MESTGTDSSTTEHHEPPHGSFWRQNQALLILAPFLLVALVIVALGYESYQIANNNRLYERAIAAGEPEKAIPPLMALIDRQPEVFDWQRRLGLVEIDLGRYEEALAVFNKILAAYPAMDLHEPLMIVHFELGQFEEGTRHMNALLARNPLDPAANYYRGRELMRRGLFSEAGSPLRIAGTDPKWDERAAPLRRELAAKVFGEEAPGP